MRHHPSKPWSHLEAEIQVYPAATELNRLIRSAWMLSYIQRGVWEISTPGAEVRVRPGELLWIPSGLPCDYRIPAGGRCTRVRLRAGLWLPQSPPDLEALDLIRRIDALVARRGPLLPLVPASRPPLRRLLADLASTWPRMDQALYHLRLKALAMDLLQLLHRDPLLASAIRPTHAPPPGEHARRQIAPALELLEKEKVVTRDNLRVSELAKACGYGVSRFHTLFVQATGLTPIHYLTERRIALACQWLSAPSSEILATAFRCGFGSTSRFYKAFKRATGMSPGAWKRQQGFASPPPLPTLQPPPDKPGKSQARDVSPASSHRKRKGPP